MAGYGDAPPEFVDRMRSVCDRLPETEEQKAWAGIRWRVRTRTFAQVLDLESGEAPQTIMTFRSQGPEFEILSHLGHPFFVLGWGRDVLGMVLDDDTDWDEVAELITESYCVLAPKKLVERVDRPDD